MYGFLPGLPLGVSLVGSLLARKDEHGCVISRLASTAYIV
jgi:hypothetical protein